jgi:hypothetical protein
MRSQLLGNLRACSFLVFVFAIAAGYTTNIAFAQAGYTEITVDVRDQKESVVPGARITVTEGGTNQVYAATTDASGMYTFTKLKPGSYTVTVEAVRFKRFVGKGIQLITGERSRLDVTLEVGGVDETVTVTSDAPLLRTESSALGQVISNEKIVKLPLNGRSFVPLVALAPGANLPPGSALPRLNGGRPRVNEYLFDGISVLQPEPGQVAFFPIIDAIQEFKVESNSPSAEFGRFDGGLVNLTTKSGTNDFHGSVFEFFRNEVLNARNLFAPKTPSNPKRPVFRRNQFGFVFGGPIIKEKTFFFGDYQGTRQQIGRIRISTVPTLLQRQGVFTEPVGGVTPRIFDPATTRRDSSGGFTRDQFDGARIPLGQIDPIALALLNRFPEPTSAGTANNYRRVANEKVDQNQFDARIDHRFSDRNQVFGRFSYAKDITDSVAPLPDGSGLIPTGVFGLSKTLGQALASSYIHTFSPRINNEVRFGYSRRSLGRSGVTLDAPPSVSLKLPGIPANAAFGNALPTFSIDGFQQLGARANTNSIYRTDVTHLVDLLYIQRGKHTTKLGIDFRWERLDVLQPSSPTGVFQFSSLFTDLPGTAGTGNALASFLLGQVQNFSIDLQQKVLRPRAHFQEFFAQDDWKITSRLTINAGLRYTLNFPSTEVDNLGSVFNLETQKLQYLGRDGFSRTARELHWNNIGPRLGLAYRPTDNTVARLGYAFIWFQQAGFSTSFTTPQVPFIQTVNQRSVDNINPAFTLSSGPSVAPIELTPDAGLGQGVFAVDRDLGSGNLQQWNLAIQRALTGNLSLEVAYAGSKITHLGVPDVNINQLTAEQLKMGAALLQRVPNPFFGQIPRSSSLGDPTISQAQLLKPFPRFTSVGLFRDNIGNSNYHALQVKLEKRLSKGVSFLVSYTRSKLIDDASFVFDATSLAGPLANSPIADSFNRRLERDVSTGDISNIFVASYTYELPFGKGYRFKPSGLIGKLVDGWELSGIITAQSGLPLAVTQATNFNAFAGFGLQRPNRVANPELSASERSVARFFNTDAFTVAPQFTLGSSSRNPVRGPAYRNLDLALIRRTPIRENMSLEFRSEVFNLTNTPQLGAPNVVLGTPGFGSITSAGDPRVIQFALKLNF